MAHPIVHPQQETISISTEDNGPDARQHEEKREMAHITYTQPRHRSVFTVLADMFGAMATRYAQHRLYTRTLRELGRLGERELADLGLHRASLKSVAYHATYDA